MKPMHLKKKQYNKKKLTLTVLSVILAVSCAVSGTAAWLISKSNGPVINNFIGSNLEITLIETTDGYKMVPGQLIAKDPKVTVVKDSVNCYLFLKVTETTDPKLDDYITYSIADGWMSYGSETASDTYYYRIVEGKTNDQPFWILKGYALDGYENGCVQIPDTVTKEQLAAINAGDVKLTFSVCAVQYDAMNDVAAAFSYTGW